jgi:hypothetical protein
VTTVREAAEIVLADLARDGWSQAPGGQGPGRDQLCIVRAVTRASVIAHGAGIAEGFAELERALTGHVRSLGYQNIAEWNDDPSTSYEDVVLAVKQAAGD